jgi:hypothetical protein
VATLLVPAAANRRGLLIVNTTSKELAVGTSLNSSNLLVNVMRSLIRDDYMSLADLSNGVYRGAVFVRADATGTVTYTEFTTT